MIIKINTIYLKEYQLTAHEYVILYLLRLNNMSELKRYLNFSGTFEKLPEIMKGLQDKGFVENNSTALVSLPSVVLTKKFNESEGLNISPFQEFYESYPIKVTRPDGTVDYLRMNRVKCKELYHKLIQFDHIQHKAIINALKTEVKQREAKGSMKYMRKMYNWLTDRHWETDVAINQGVDTVQSIDKKYGEDII